MATWKQVSFSDHTHSGLAAPTFTGAATFTGSIVVANTSADLQATFGANNEALDDTYIRIIGRNTANSSGYNFDIGMDADVPKGYLSFGGTTALSLDTSGNATFNGNIGIGTASTGDYNASMNNLVVYETGGNAGISIITDNNLSGYLAFGDGTGSNTYRGIIYYDHSTDAMSFGTGWVGTGATVDMRISSDGKVGIGTTSPSEALHISGSGTTKLFVEGDISGSAQSTGSFGSVHTAGRVGIGTASPLGIL
ncbi:hypothetical protein CMI47_07005, partial [Candidatus Pacearchaeota archaeon]|nr:hypothetical protein [Candidatus Pacearchaeota archaeon]